MNHLSYTTPGDTILGARADCRNDTLVSVFHPAGPTFFELMEEALSSTRRGYDLIAPKFDLTPFRTPDEVLAHVAPYLGGDRSIARALDICCGTGAVIRFLRPICREEVVGLDLSGGMLKQARWLAASPGPPTIRLVHGDAMALPFREVFDLATCFGALGHILQENERRFVRGVRNVLVSGGRFVFLTSPLPPILSRAWVLSRGFNVVMRVRNAIWRPAFIMYYLTFRLWECVAMLRSEGFSIALTPSLSEHLFKGCRLVIATKV
jgi:ubiquinone/menaquinone biosynthesis C-methylase UbiE